MESILFLVMGIAFFIAELLTLSFYAFFISIGCLLVALFLFLKCSFTLSLCAGAVLTLTCVVVFQKIFGKKRQQQAPISPFENLIGEKGVLSEGINGSHGTVVIGGTSWRAVADTSLASGTCVVVSALDPVENMTLVVKKI
ncbi:MAG: NfeD family protein [Desulfovibrionaceae bacterium]